MKRYSILFILLAIATVRALAAVDCGTANDEETTWPIPLHKYANNAAMVCKVMMGETPIENADVGVFSKSDDECRGGVVTNSKGYAWMMIYGDTNSEEMYFKVKVDGDTYTVKQTYTYLIDDSKGTNANPVILQLEDIDNVVQIAPAVISSDDKKKEVDVYLYNPSGQCDKLSFNLTLPDGINITKTSLVDRTEDKSFWIICNQSADGSYTISLSSTDKSNIEGIRGNVLRLTLTADASAAPGLGYMNIKDVVLGDAGSIPNQPVDYKASLFYGKSSDMPSGSVSLYGNFTLANAEQEFADVLADCKDISMVDLTQVLSLDPTKTIHTGNGNTLVYVAHGMTIGNEDNVVVDDNCANFVIYDDQKFSVIKAFHADKVSYTRTGLRAGGMYTLALPFGGDIPEGCSLYAYDYVDLEKNEVHFDETDALLSDTPYLIKSAGSSITVNATDINFTTTPSYVSDDDFICTYEGVEAGSLTDCYALYSDGSGFGICDATAYATSFHGYINIKRTSGAKAKFYRLCLGEETGIVNVSEAPDYGNKIYNLNGQRLSTIQHGISIMNGKKVMKN